VRRLKRHARLAPLSRHHTEALIEGKALRDLPADADEVRRRAAADRFVAFWRADGAAHFRVEEDVLLPWLARYGRSEEPCVVRMLLDHAAIRGMALELSEAGPPRLELLHRLGDRLMEHVRLEEEQVFPLTEATLPEEALARLAF